MGIWSMIPGIRAVSVAVLGAGLAGCAADKGSPVDSRNLERGRALYQNHCVVCHTPKVHRRLPALPVGTDDLRYIVTMWATHQSLHWGKEEIEDVVYYLDRVHYRFEK